MSEKKGKWKVAISGSKSDLEHLASHFISSDGHFSKDDLDSGFLYTSEKLEDCETAEDVSRLARNEMRVLSGILRLVRNSNEPLLAGVVYWCYPSGGRDVFVMDQEGIQVRAELGDVTVSVSNADGSITPSCSSPPQTLVVAKLARSSSSVTKAMRLIAASDYMSWGGLYRLYEVIEGDMGGEHELKTVFCGSAKDIKRFKHSANSVTVAGDDARHANESGRPPEQPMTLYEAEAFLKYLLKRWLAEKGV